MKKNLFAVLLTILMVVALIPSVFAAYTTDFSNVALKSEILVRKNGTGTWDGAEDELVLTATEVANDKVDFRVILDDDELREVIRYWYNEGKKMIALEARGDAAEVARLEAYFDQFPVTGEFTVTISNLGDLDIPAEYTANSQNMVGFNAEAKDLFEEVSRTFDGSVLTIKIRIKHINNFDKDSGAAIPGIMESTLNDGVQEANPYLLPALTLDIPGVGVKKLDSEMSIPGVMTGFTGFKIGLSDTASDRVNFTADGQNARLIPYRAPSTPGGSVVKSYKITFNVDGDTKEYDPLYVKEGNVSVNDLPSGKKQGYTFDGWYLDSAMTEKVTDKIYVDKNMTLYGHRKSTSLDTEHHYAYVIGYPDETVRPDNNITREEVAMIFYRLLRDDIRAELRTSTNSFSDVATERWSNVAISTMAEGDYITGYPDGTFRPGANITRAEFATMATRFASLLGVADTTFTDIDGHWAEQYILKATKAGWIAGYPDGTFKPENPITRAEVMTIINRVLARSVNKAGLHADTRFWIDMNENEWFYFIVLEATNSHTFTRQEDGINEIWTAIIENKTWD